MAIGETEPLLAVRDVLERAVLPGRVSGFLNAVASRDLDVTAAASSLYDLLLTLRQGSPHGGPFAYRSCETDALGWACEQAAGARMPELMADLLWSRLGVSSWRTLGRRSGMSRTGRAGTSFRAEIIRSAAAPWKTSASMRPPLAME